MNTGLIGYQVLCAILLKNSRYQNFNKIMMKNLNLNKSFTLIVVLSIYFIGFIFREISNGAAHTDLEFHIWKIIVDFKLNFSDSFKNYVDYEEGTLPFFHLFQTFINPFNNDIFEYTLSNTILNLLIPIILFLIIKKKLNSNIAFYISLLLLISPWFRSTSYWGTTENFALFFIIPSLIYFEKIINSKDEYVKNNIFLIIFLSFSIYARQQYFFLVIAHIILIFYNRYSFKNILLFFTIYAIFSVPGFFTLLIWNAHENIKVSTSNSEYISISNIFYNIIIISNILFYYLCPFLIINFKEVLKLVNIRNIVKLIIIFIFFIFI